jgi:glutamate 5-kinase
MDPQQIQGLRDQLRSARRVVIKVGSQVLCKPDGTLDAAVLVALCRDLARLLDEGREVLLVSSGAVASGRGSFSDRDPPSLGKQALAAIGQPLLMARYRQLFEAHGRHVAQILLTHADLGDRSRFLHARRVMAELMAAGILPIVNENDTVAVEELKFGDNDALAAQVAHVVSADAVVLLTEVDGLYTADPRLDPHAVLLPCVGHDDETVLAMAGLGTSQFGTGGMRSKVLAARKAGSVGVLAAIAHGKKPGNLLELLAGKPVGTIFAPATRRLTGKRSWIATSVRPRGTVHVDAGAAQALREGGRSLLPIGVVRIEGAFQVGDPVQVCDPHGDIVGRGLTRYDSEDAIRAAGRRTEQISRDLGWLPVELIHRDDFVRTR